VAAQAGEVAAAHEESGALTQQRVGQLLEKSKAIDLDEHRRVQAQLTESTGTNRGASGEALLGARQSHFSPPPYQPCSMSTLSRMSTLPIFFSFVSHSCLRLCSVSHGRAPGAQRRAGVCQGLCAGPALPTAAGAGPSRGRAQEAKVKASAAAAASQEKETEATKAQAEPQKAPAGESSKRTRYGPPWPLPSTHHGLPHLPLTRHLASACQLSPLPLAYCRLLPALWLSIPALDYEAHLHGALLCFVWRCRRS